MLPDEKIANLSTSTVCNINVSSIDKTTTANAATTTSNISNFNSEDQQSKKSDKKPYLQAKKDVIEPSLTSDCEQIDKNLSTSLSSGELIKFLKFNKYLLLK